MPAIAVEDALEFPSLIFTTIAHFFSGTNAAKIPSAPFLKKTFFSNIFVKMLLSLSLPPVYSGLFTHELNIFLLTVPNSPSFSKSENDANN